MDSIASRMARPGHGAAVGSRIDCSFDAKSIDDGRCTALPHGKYFSLVACPDRKRVDPIVRAGLSDREPFSSAAAREISVEPAAFAKPGIGRAGCGHDARHS